MVLSTKQSGNSFAMFRPQSHILALDFDGVIVDSIEECLIIGHNAYSRHTGRGRAIARSEAMAAGIAIESRRLRNFIRYGEDYVFIFQALESGKPIATQAGFDDFMKSQTHLRAVFRERFYKERERFFSHQRAIWLSLNPLYPGMDRFLARFEPKSRLFIITTKNTDYVHPVLHHHGIRLTESHVLQATPQMTKRKHMMEIMDLYSVSPSRIHFVDDQVDTLMDARDSAFHCYLAEWGYTNADQIMRAKKNKISVLDLEAFFDWFQGWP